MEELGEEVRTDIDKLLLRPSPLAHEGFQASEEMRDFFLHEAKILIIGAGGLGCEVIKNLAMMGIKNIDIIDLDRIDVTNLNRQFLFRQADVGKFKAEVAADFVKKRVPGANVNYYTTPIQKFDAAFYSEYQIFVAGLDNVEARRWLNSMVFSLVELDEDNEVVPETQKIIIDGGTEVFNGQARVIIPYQTACYECTLESLTDNNNFNFCTIKHTPRQPEHCIAYIFLIEWEKHWKEVSLDNDNPEHITWVYEESLKRADEFGIKGVTRQMTLGVVKNIIPAIASTNCTIAAACCNEVMKIMTYCAPPMNNYMLIVGKNRINCDVTDYTRKPNCPICNVTVVDFKVNTSWIVEELVR